MMMFPDFWLCNVRRCSQASTQYFMLWKWDHHSRGSRRLFANCNFVRNKIKSMGKFLTFAATTWIYIAAIMLLAKQNIEVQCALHHFVSSVVAMNENRDLKFENLIKHFSLFFTTKAFNFTSDHLALFRHNRKPQPSEKHHQSIISI